MKKEPTEKQRQQILINSELARISNIPLAGNERFFFGFSGMLLKQYDCDFIVETLNTIPQYEFAGTALYAFVRGVLKKEYLKVYEPCWEGLDAIGR